MLQTSTEASISDLFSFTVDDLFWGEIFLSTGVFILGFNCLVNSKDKIELSVLTLCQVRMVVPPPLRNGRIFMKAAECAETNEKSIFRFLVFEIWSFWYS